MDLKQIVKDKIAELGEEKAAEFFDKKASAIKVMVKTGNIPLAMVQKVLDSRKAEAESKPPDGKVVSASEVLQRHDQLLGQVLTWLNSIVVPFFEKGLAERDAKITDLETRLSDVDAKTSQISMSVQGLYQPQRSNGGPTIGDIIARDPDRILPSLTRPQPAVTLQTFTTAPAVHPLDSGIAPTQAQVEQSRKTAEGGVPGQQSKLAGPATPNPDAEAIGAPGWTKPWAPR